MPSPRTAPEPASPEPGRLLLAVGDPRRRARRLREFAALGVEAVPMRDVVDLIDALANGPADALLIDLGFGGVRPASLFAYMAHRPQTALIVIAGEAGDRLDALAGGADDSVASGCASGEILARFGAIRRRLHRGVVAAAPPPARFGIGSVVYCPRRKRLLGRGGLEAIVPPLPARLLDALLARPGEPLSREELKIHGWSRPDVGEVDLNVAIHRLRGLIVSVAGARQWIASVPGGYRLAVTAAPLPAR